MENKIIISGFGGQGILFFGCVLAYSCMLENKEVTWFPSYGAEVRGGTANCTVIISDELIGSPIVSMPDILIIMNDESLIKFQSRIKKQGLLIFDSSLIKKNVLRNDIEIIAAPATEIASNLGNTKTANMVLLGTIIAKTKLFKKDSAFNALRNIIQPNKKNSIEINKKAIIKGIQFIEDKKGKNI